MYRRFYVFLFSFPCKTEETCYSFNMPSSIVKKLLLVSSLFLFLYSYKITVIAKDCEQTVCNSEDKAYESCLQEKKKCLEEKLDEVRQEKTTLNNTISVFNGSINIQEVKINQTVAEINKLEQEVEMLDNRISGLGISLDRLTTLLVDRIRSQYKQKAPNPVVLLLASKSFNKFITQYHYLSLAGKQTAQAMQRAEFQRNFYDEQKLAKEQKQKEIEAKRYQLQKEQNQLVEQRKEKRELLKITQNNEAKFQELLQEAETQLASFRRFVNDQGGASILSNQTSCDDWGCYYNQRDNQWGSQYIGKSNSTMAEYGCLVTSMAMVASHYHKSLTPGQIASSSVPFWLNTAYMRLGSSWSVNGVTMTRTRVGYNSNYLDSALSSGKPVIVGIGSGPDHFLVIKEKKDSKYIMRDPFTINGKDIEFSSKYSLSSISTVDKVLVN